MPPEPLGVLLISGTHERAHYAFSMAAAAAALFRPAVLFATNRGCIALMSDWHALTDAGRDATIQTRGVAGLDTLRTALVDLGVRLLVCDAGLKAEALDAAALIPQAEIAGLATFLTAVGAGRIVSF